MIDEPPPPSVDPAPHAESQNVAHQIREAKRVARGTGTTAAVVALIAIGAGLSGHGDIALWCIPFFVVLGAISSASNQNAKKLAKGDGAPIHVAKETGLNALGVFLALVLIAALVIGYLFYLLSHLRGG